jgi:16S rRNA processing protein RimM
MSDSVPSSSTPSGASSESPSGALVAVGRILGPHGRDGGIRLKATSDVPGRFDVGESLSASRDGIIAEGRTYQIAKSRSTGPKGKDELILWFTGFRDRGQAQRLTGLWLCVPQSEVPSAQEGEYFHYQLIGLKVRTVEGEDLGELAEILETGSNDVYVVTGLDGEILVPALSKVVREVDIAGGLMVVDLPEGLR